jgi:hypothetical protein
MKIKCNNSGNSLLLQVYAALIFITSVLSSPIIIANSDLSSITPVIAEFENNVGKRNVYIAVNSTSKYTTTTMDTVSKLPLGSMIDPETLSQILAENEINAPVYVSRREAVAAAVRAIKSATYDQIRDTIFGVSKHDVIATDRTIKPVAYAEIMDTVSKLPLGSAINLAVLSKLFTEINVPADVSNRDNVSAADRTIEFAASAEIMTTLSKIPLGSTVDSDIMSQIAADIMADIAANVSQSHSLQKRNTTTAHSEAAALSDLDQTISHLPLGSQVDSKTIDQLFSELNKLDTTSEVDTDASPTISSAAEDANAMVPRDPVCLLGVCGNKGSLCRKHDVPCTIDMTTKTVNCPTCQCTQTDAVNSPVRVPSRLFSSTPFFSPINPNPTSFSSRHIS